MNRNTELCCAACRVKVGRITLPDGTASYTHPGSSGHTVVPVLMTPADVIRVCDFCLARHPRWAVPLREPATNTLPQGGFRITAVDVDGWWAACTDCALLVRERRAGLLRHRAYQGWQATTGTWPDKDQRTGVNAQLAAFWRAGPGAPVTIITA